MEDFVGHEKRLFRGDAQALVLGENVSDAVTNPRVGQLTRISVPQIF